MSDANWGSKPHGCYLFDQRQLLVQTAIAEPDDERPGLGRKRLNRACQIERRLYASAADFNGPLITRAKPEIARANVMRQMLLAPQRRFYSPSQLQRVFEQAKNLDANSAT